MTSKTHEIGAKIESFSSIKAEMLAVARGERPAPADAARPRFASAEALLRLLTPENRKLLALIRDEKPQPIAELAQLTGREASNLTRTVVKLEAFGFIKSRTIKRRKVMTTPVRRVRVDIDPFAQDDRVELA